MLAFPCIVLIAFISKKCAKFGLDPGRKVDDMRQCYVKN